MTYLFKLVRRLAISRSFVTLPLIALLAACAGESTSPDVDTGTAAGIPAALQVFPRSVTIETSQRVQFRGQSETMTGRSVETSLVWTASGGTIRPDGSFSASAAGLYKIFARGRGWKHSDTAVVHVVAPQPQVAQIVVAPHPLTVETGATRAFTASAYLADGSEVELGVKWSATGGTVDAAGTFTADTVAGDFQVVASNTAGTVADTAHVTVVLPGTGSVPAAAPSSPGKPAAPIHPRVIVRPASISLIVGGRQQYRAFGRKSTGDSVAVGVTFKATGGTINKKGLYTAGKKAGTFRVIATANGRADTALVTLSVAKTPAAAPTPTPVPAPTPTPAPPPVYTGKLGVSVGLFGMVSAGIDPGPYNGSVDSYSASNIVSRIATARAKKMRLLLMMTGGTHANYMTGGKFDLAKWQAKMNTYNTPAIKQAIAAAVEDGTIIGSSVMDEPANVTKTNNWGPAGTMTKAKVDQLCAYVKGMFPSLPTGVVHDYRVLEPEKNYQQCEFIVSQYRLAKQPVMEYRDGALAFGRRSNIAVAFSLNVLHGGTPGTSCPKYGDDPSGTLCAMTPEQIRSFGTTLGSVGCSLSMWRYERGYFDQPQIQAAVRAVSDSLAKLPRKRCGRS